VKAAGMSTRPRLLPWNNPEGQPCYLMTGDSGTGHVARLADEMEALRLRAAAEIRGHARALLAEQKAEAGELRFLAHRLLEALHDALRVAESRGARLPQPVDDGPDDDHADDPLRAQEGGPSHVAEA
jgi:hypothetical protein